MMKKLLALAAGFALIAGVAACTSHKGTGDAEKATTNDQSASQETVVVAEAPTTTMTKGEY